MIILKSATSPQTLITQLVSGEHIVGSIAYYTKIVRHFHLLFLHTCPERNVVGFYNGGIVIDLILYMDMDLNPSIVYTLPLYGYSFLIDNVSIKPPVYRQDTPDEG